jgi:Tol biopolymer transport system component
VAVDRRHPNTGRSDIWLIELARGISSRFTFDPKDDVEPIWSADGKWIVFSSDRNGTFDLYKKSADGGSPERLLIQSNVDKRANDWSRDGRFLLYGVRSSNGQAEVLPVSGDQTWVLPLSGDAKPAPFHRTEFTNGYSSFSPDGKWIAYMSDQSSRFEIYVRAFQAGRAAATGDYAGGGEWQISEGGGSFPHWRRDGRELFYRTSDGRTMAAPVTTGATFQAGVARVIFTSNFGERAIPDNFAVTGDGQHFLMLSPLQTESLGATIISNWTKKIEH